MYEIRFKHLNDIGTIAFYQSYFWELFVFVYLQLKANSTIDAIHY